jgi:hypothetical protein
VGFYDTPGDAEGVAVSDTYVYVADGSFGLRVVDVANPTRPTEVGVYDTPGNAVDVAVSGSYVYVADEAGGLFILRISAGAPTPTPTATPTPTDIASSWAPAINVSQSVF